MQLIETWMLKILPLRTQEGSEESGRESYYLTEYTYHQKQNAGRKINIKGVSGEGSEELRKTLLQTGTKSFM